MITLLGGSVESGRAVSGCYESWSVKALKAWAEVLRRWAEALMKGVERIVELAEAFEGDVTSAYSGGDES